MMQKADNDHYYPAHEIISGSPDHQAHLVSCGVLQIGPVLIMRQDGGDIYDDFYYVLPDDLQLSWTESKCGKAAFLEVSRRGLVPEELAEIEAELNPDYDELLDKLVEFLTMEMDELAKIAEDDRLARAIFEVRKLSFIQLIDQAWLKGNKIAQMVLMAKEIEEGEYLPDFSALPKTK